MCKVDILFWINSFVFQVNPNKNEVGPFITWPFQERALLDDRKLLWWTENKEDGCIEKSRDMGATWLYLITDEWLRRFHDYHDSLLVSKSAAAVDGPSHQSLFGKLRFIHRHLPLWMNDPWKVRDQKNFMGYPNGSTLGGFASTGKAGVSERASSFGIDEVAQIDEDFEVIYRTSSTCRSRTFISTHMGTGTAFHALCQRKDINKIRLHWTQHPDKNKGLYYYDQVNHKVKFLAYNDKTDEVEETNECSYPYPPDYEYDQTGRPSGGPFPGVRSFWYDREFARMLENESEMAKDHDINPQGSVSQFYHPLAIKNLQEMCFDPFWVGELDYNHDTGKPEMLTEKPGGRLKIWFMPNRGVPPVSDYGIGVDVSHGVGRTPSCISIVDGRTGEKVAELIDSRIEPSDLATLCFALCNLFRNESMEGAKIAWENTGPGAPFGKRLYEDLGYRNVHCNRPGFVSFGSTVLKPGWIPDKKSKVVLHSEYRAALSNRDFLNRSKSALDETLNFHHIDNTIEHVAYKNKSDPAVAKANHGDIVVADALAYLCIRGMMVTRAQKQVEELTIRSMAGRRKLRELQEAEMYG